MNRTPGTWTLDTTRANGHGGWAIMAGSVEIATAYANIVVAPPPVGGMAAMPENAESIANGTLMALAPELADALRILFVAATTMAIRAGRTEYEAGAMDHARAVLAPLGKRETEEAAR